MSAFEELGVCPEIIKAIEHDGWLLPTPVQAEVIPLALGGQDLCVAAETGSGKTGAFGIPCVQIVHEILTNRANVPRFGGQKQQHTSNDGHIIGSAAQNISPHASSTILNIDDKDSMVLVGDDGLVCLSKDPHKWAGIRATTPVFYGRYMFEVEILSRDGKPRVGWSPAHSSFALGTSDASFGFGFTGKKSWNNSFETYGRPFSQGDVVGCLIDRDELWISFTLNGEFLGHAYKIPQTLSKRALFPTICGKTFEVRCRFGSFTFPVEGYDSLDNIPSNETSPMLEKRRECQTNSVIAIILEPTKDLAIQTYKCLQTFARHLNYPPIRLGLFVGGMNDGSNCTNQIDVCVGTVSKLSDMIRRSQINVSQLRYLIVDEADDLIKAGQEGDIIRLKQYAETSQYIQTSFFSATLHSTRVRDAINKITNNPSWIDLKGKPCIPDTVHFVSYEVDPLTSQNPNYRILHDQVHTNNPANAKESASLKIKLLKPQILITIADKLKITSALVFCRTNLDCDNLERFLTSFGGGRSFGGKSESGKENPYSCVVLAGMRSIEDRIAALKHFKDGDVRFLICTDVAARGVDIEELPCVIMMNLPDDSDQFFHRVGRIGRADRLGLAISIVSTTHEEKVWYHKCANRGKGCSNTRLTSEGGCTVWFNEAEYKKEIERRIGQDIPRMDPKTFSVPGILELDSTATPTAVLPSRCFSLKTSNCEGMSYAMTMYGKPAAVESTTSARHVTEVSGAVNELTNLESKAQKLYVALATLGVS